MDGLFRDEVVQAQRPQALGAVSLATPLSFVWWALLAAALATAVILFLIFGHYTQRETVSGQLEPVAGMLTLSAQTTGTVTSALVHQGERVKAGQSLLRVSANLASASMGDTHAVVAVQLRAQEAQIRTTLAGLQPQAAEQAKDLQRRIGMLDAQVSQIDGQLRIQRQQIDAATQLLQKAAPLHEHGIVSTIQFDQYRNTALSEQAQGKVLVRQRLDTDQQISTLQTRLAQLPLDSAAKANQLRGQLAQLDAQLAENASQGETVVHASRAGTVSTLLVKLGQSVTARQPVLSILPQGSKLEAQLLVPSSAIGFVAPGSRVVLRYQAFPYQRFGQQYGKVVQISRSALTPAEAQSLPGQGQKRDAPLYRILVALDHQHINTYGNAELLLPGGMKPTVTAEKNHEYSQDNSCNAG